MADLNEIDSGLLGEVVVVANSDADNNKDDGLPDIDGSDGGNGGTGSGGSGGLGDLSGDTGGGLV